MEEPNYQGQKIVASAAVLVAMAVIVFGVSVFEKRDNSIVSSESSDTAPSQIISSETVSAASQPTEPASITESVAQPAPAPAPVPVTKFKDGTYSATGNYQTPESTESISVTVTIAGDMITNTSASANAKNSESKAYLSDFIGGYKSKVVGKALASLQLGNVSGASLTPTGFNNAIAQIRAQAQN